jgi:hypothetical protein
VTPGERAVVDQLLAEMDGQVTALVEYYRAVEDRRGSTAAAQRVGCLVADNGPVKLAAWLSIAVQRLSNADEPPFAVSIEGGAAS